MAYRRMLSAALLALGVVGMSITSAAPQGRAMDTPNRTEQAPLPETPTQEDGTLSPEAIAPEEEMQTGADAIEEVEEGTEVDASAIGDLPPDLSPWSMFVNADVVVKTVIVGLALASFVTWTIWLAKGVSLHGAKLRAARATRRLENAKSLGEAAKGLGSSWSKRGPVSALVAAAEQERWRSLDASPDGIKERAAIALSRIEAQAGRRMATGTGLLATIGATAPFVGLFGTVWGIMNAFIGISKAQTTNLAVVAPGIAEALLATGVGLVAAIPAVIIYNIFARSISGYRALLADASGEVLRHLSRDLERSAPNQGRDSLIRTATPLQRATPAE
jgi:biopolymer transport protein ExbB